MVNTEIFLERRKRFFSFSKGDFWRRQYLLFLGTIVERSLLVLDPPEDMSSNIKDTLFAL